jgi:predicted porin
MNKKLVAVAVAGLLAAPLAAQAQTANVTLYGRLNLDMEVIINAKNDNTAPNNNNKQNIYRVNSNSSRLGVRGSEALGGGLSAIFQIESAVGATNGGGLGSSLGTRETFAGLQGGWGTVKVGYFLGPYDDIAPIFGSVPTLITGILGTSALWSNTGWTANSQYGGAFDDRLANSVRYDTPNIAGFTGSIQIGAGQTGGDATNGGNAVFNPATPTTQAAQRRHAYATSVNGLYNNGPFQAGIAYEFHNNFRDGTAANPSLQDEGITAAASWNFGVVKVAGVYEQLRYDIAAGGNVKRNFWGASATWNLGPGQAYFYYGWAGNGTGSAADFTSTPMSSQVGAVRKGSDTGAQQWSVSYTYALSKRTLTYAGYNMIANKANGAYNFHVNQINGLCGQAVSGNASSTGCGNAAKPQGLALGLVQFF